MTRKTVDSFLTVCPSRIFTYTGSRLGMELTRRDFRCVSPCPSKVYIHLLFWTPGPSGDKVKTTWRQWSAFLSEDRNSFTIGRHSRLLAIESNEIEHVFLLGGKSLVKLVRAGFYTGVIECVLESPSGKSDLSAAITILKNFAP
ncbi:hypothetical protein GALMADRAFT_657994 [Galerina marginata CBS 339.88]|uniref:Uncharacterized protein n=1 Tax=Galerina marginata (strain CBS 339.88) TaxID=685588 RepID=A0A067TK75_GALM3|nr:hypothetical protein GALMADRAFT_657994 [Galerina marginata CBS 339.88]